MEPNIVYGLGIVPIIVCNVVEGLSPSVIMIFGVPEEFGFWVGVRVRTRVSSRNIVDRSEFLEYIC